MPRRRPIAPVPRKQPKQERATVTVDAMVTAVERVLEKHGPAGLTTNRVAEVAGVSVGTLYQWFPNKEALVSALQERYIQQTFGLCRAALAAADGVAFSAVVERVAFALVAAMREQRPIHRWLNDLRSASATQGRWRHAVDELVDEVAVFLASRADVGDLDPRPAAFVLVHAIQGIAEAVGDRGSTVDVGAVAREAIRMVQRYTGAITPTGRAC
jgi:AcrR family transcriptional regulator